MRYELIKRGRTANGIETMYRSSLSLDETEELRAIQELFAEELRSALGIEFVTGVQMHVLVDMADGVYIADILEQEDQRINILPKVIVTNQHEGGDYDGTTDLHNRGTSLPESGCEPMSCHAGLLEQ